jgi:nucleoside-triphosphatase
MMMKIFLTGEIQIGKSTVINKTLALLKITPGGFRTYFGPDREAPDRLLYLNAASEPKTYHDQNAIAVFAKDKPPYVLTEKFNTYGAELVRSASENASLILMDECGSLEKDALQFQNEILKTLAGETPVLGVVKPVSGGWTDFIRRHRQVKLITVTEDNRNSLPYLLAELLKSNLVYYR